MPTDDELNDSSRFRDMPSDGQPWHIVAQNTYEHYREHAANVEKWLKRRGSR